MVEIYDVNRGLISRQEFESQKKAKDYMRRLNKFFTSGGKVKAMKKKTILYDHLGKSLLTLEQESGKQAKLARDNIAILLSRGNFVAQYSEYDDGPLGEHLVE